MPPTEPTPQVEQVTKKSHKKVLLTLGIVVLLSLAGLAAYLWNSQVTELKADLNSANQKITELEKQSNSNSEGSETADDTEDKYLEITEWGVKIKLTENITDVVYELRSFDSFESVGLSTTRLGQASEFCSPSRTSSGSIARVKDKNASAGFDDSQSYMERYPDGKEVNGYFYFFSGPQATCSETETELEGKVFTELKSATQTISPI